MTFQPILPWPVMAVACVAVTALTAWTIWHLARPWGSVPRQRVRPAALRGAAVVLLLLAALRPGLAGGHSDKAAADIDVFFVVDTSTSMAAEDYRGTETRLAGVKQDVMAIAKELAGAKFSLITFDSTASVRIPLTRDTTALQTARPPCSPKEHATPKAAA